MLDKPDISLSTKDVQTLIDEIKSETIVLPDFQRDFVWPTKQVGKLLESVLNGYYINTILALPVVRGNEEENVPFPSRTVKGSENGNQGKRSMTMKMILDGQQRITSLYYSLTSPDFPLDNTKYPQLFYLKFSKVINGELDEDSVGWRRKDWDTSKKLIDNDYELQIKKDMIPFTIFESKESFKKWRRGMEKFVEDLQRYDKKDIDKFDDYTEIFRNYPIPIIELSADTPDSMVVQTFERINTQGLELGIFDILTARLWPDNINLRDLWDDALDEYKLIDWYSNMVGENKVRERVLKTLALYRGQECKDTSLGQLDSDNFNSDWQEATRIMERALDKSSSSDAGGFGVTEKFGFPYNTMLPTLANLIYEVEENSKYPEREGLEKIQRWYWCSVFSKRYSGSSDSISYKDYNEVIEWIKNNGDNPEAIRNSRAEISNLELKTLTRGGPYKGIMSLIYLNGAKSFGNLESINIHKVDDHHIFPKSKLKNGSLGKIYDETERNSILNRTIIQYKENRFKYQDELPSTYIPKMISDHPEGKQGVKNLLKDHLICDKAFTALLNDDYDSFCESRMESIRKAIEEKVGIDIPWSSGESVI